MHSPGCPYARDPTEEAVMTDDDHSSEAGESMQEFVTKKVRLERDFDAEAAARKALVDSLVGRKPKPIDIRKGEGSVVMARKKPAGRPRSHDPVQTPMPLPARTDDAQPVVRKIVVADVIDTVKEEVDVVSVALQEPVPTPIVRRHRSREANVSDTLQSDSPKKRVGAESKLKALAEVAAEAGDPRQLTARGITAEAAKRIDIRSSAMRTHWNRYLNAEQRTYLLYGDTGKKVTRAEEKYSILLQLRAQMRDEKKLAPTKSEFIPLAAKKLGMTEQSTSTYIYERLTDEQKLKLEFALPANDSGYSLDEQIGILKIVRKEMREKGLPAPRHIDLAQAAAARLKQKASSVRTLIGSFSNELKEELELLESRSGKLQGLSAFHVREGFTGALAVLRLRKMKLTIRNLQKILDMKRPVIESYLADNPDVRTQLIDEVIKNSM